METIRQIITVTAERKVEFTLPDSVKPGLIEMVIVLQPLPNTPQSKQANIHKNLFGFLPRRIDPLEFERQIRNEWGR
ncbi:MAG: hypothetical protein LH660_00520 [Phormidesmis sp. CAN_BIN36]|nr:hypothetical protein [Phormidesmis sp. CAN_BIN36]